MDGKNTHSGSRRVIGFLVGALIVAIFTTIAVYLHKEQQASYSHQFNTNTNALRALPSQFARNATAAAAGLEEGFIRLERVQSEFQGRYLILKENRERGLVLAKPINEKIDTELAALAATWSNIQGNTQSVLDRKSSVLALHGFTQTLNNLIPLLQSQNDLIVENLIDRGAPAAEVRQVQEQTLRLERLWSNLAVILAGRANFAVAADSFQRDAVAFEQVLSDMYQDESTNDENIFVLLGSIGASFKVVTDAAASVVISAPDLHYIRQLSDEIAFDSEMLQGDIMALLRSFEAIPDGPGIFWVSNDTAIITGGLLSLLLLFLTGVRLFRDGRRLEQTLADQHRDNQSAVAHLLQELEQLGEGDLTTKMTVRDDITCTIADAINRTVEQLRMEFTAISQTSLVVQKTAEDNLQTIRKLTIASEYQRREISDISTAIKQISNSLDGMAEAVRESVTTVQDSIALTEGGASVLAAIVVDMSDLVEQANILAVNAAIKAAASEDSSHFMGVAEEARLLTQQISHIVQQLEVSAQDVTIGSGSGQFEMAYQKLLLSISEIEKTAKTHALSLGDVAATINVIREIATQTARGASACAMLTGSLAEQAIEMQQSVSVFKLPEVEHVDMDKVVIDENSEAIVSKV